MALDLRRFTARGADGGGGFAAQMGVDGGAEEGIE